MIAWIVHLIIDAVVLLIAAKMMSSVSVKNFGNAFIVALIVAVLNILVGWLLTGVLNVVTLGLFYFLGLGFIIRVIVVGIFIEIADKLNSGFNTRGILPSFILALILGIVGLLIDWAFFDSFS